MACRDVFFCNCQEENECLVVNDVILSDSSLLEEDVILYKVEQTPDSSYTNPKGALSEVIGEFFQQKKLHLDVFQDVILPDIPHTKTVKRKRSPRKVAGNLKEEGDEILTFRLQNRKECLQIGADLLKRMTPKQFDEYIVDFYSKLNAEKE